MLVLTRRAGQSIMIGNDVVVTILEVSGEAVRVGIQAPSDVTVHREEVFLMLRDANQAAAVSSSDLSALKGLKAQAGAPGSKAQPPGPPAAPGRPKPQGPPKPPGPAKPTGPRGPGGQAGSGRPPSGPPPRG